MSAWRFPLVPGPAAGTKMTGWVDWGDPMLVGWQWPYIAVTGARSGPALLVTAGVHGSEYPGIDAAVSFAASLDPATVSGQVLVLPLINPPAFWGRAAFVCPLDGLNPNRQFPGKLDGAFSQRLAFHLTEKAIRHADAYVDLHGGDVVEALEPFSIFQRGGPADLASRAEALARATLLPNLLVNQYDPRAPAQGMTIAAAASHGVPAVLAEAGGCGLLEPAATELLRRALDNVARSLQIIPGPVETSEPRIYRTFVWPRTVNAGFFRAGVAVGDEVTVGQPLGALNDFFGATVETIQAPVAGRVLFLTVSAAVGADGLVAGIGVA